MNEIKPGVPGIIKFADHEVIVPPNRLKKAVKRPGDDDQRDPLTDAEEALELLSVQFQTWMDDECAQLDRARRLVNAQGFTGETRQTLFRAAHDIKGHGATFGYPMAADVADSLCRLIEHCSDFARIPPGFVDQCVDAVRAIIREGKEPNAEATAMTLAKELRALVEAFLAVSGTAGQDEPATSPPLAPA
jgi:hypothetical protein